MHLDFSLRSKGQSEKVLLMIKNLGLCSVRTQTMEEYFNKKRMLQLFVTSTQKERSKAI